LLSKHPVHICWWDTEFHPKWHISHLWTSSNEYKLCIMWSFCKHL